MGADMRVSGSELGLGMGLSLSSMGLGAQQLAAGSILDTGQQSGEDEAQRRVGAIVQLLSHRWGRVGREGVERCARRLGLECLWENHEGEGHSTLSIAGNGLLVDVDWAGDHVRAVVLSFPGAGEGAERSAAVGAEVLRRDLVGKGVGGYVGLEGFAAHLGALASMDVLGREGISCFEAVEGLRASLARVWEWELSQAEKEMPGADSEAVQREVMCARSGRPCMHASGAIGLRLEYWLSRRRVRSRAWGWDAMDIDIDADIPAPEPAGLHALLIDCEAHPSTLYPSIRVSDAWVSPSVTTAPLSPSLALNPLFVPPPNIDWLDPPPTYLPPTLTTPPAVRFRALLRPPLTLPLQKAMELFEIVGAPLTQDSIRMTTFTQLLFAGRGVGWEGAGEVVLRDAVVGFERVLRGEGGQSVRHRYTLLTGGQDWARTVSEIPFSHPRQLVMVLPLLRQWAFVGGVLGRLAGVGKVESRREEGNGSANGKGEKVNGRSAARSRRTSLENIASDTDSDTDADTDVDEAVETIRPKAQARPSLQQRLSLPIRLRRADISLSLAVPATPSITLVIPGRLGEEIIGPGRTVTFHVGLNAEIEVEEEEKGGDAGIAARDGRGRGRSKEDWGRVLSISEDLGVVVEWALGR